MRRLAAFIAVIAAAGLCAVPAWASPGRHHSQVVRDWNASASGTGSATAAGSAVVAGDVLVAYVEADGPDSASSQSAMVTGCGQTWHLLSRQARQAGDAEAWYATGASAQSACPVKATLPARGYQLAVTAADYGAAGTPTAASAHAASGAAKISLTGVPAGSMAVMNGDDWDNAIPRALLPGDTGVYQKLASVGDTYWVEQASASGNVTIGASAPTGDQWNAVAVVIPPAIQPQQQPPATPAGLTVTGTTSSTATLSWMAPAGTVTGYYLYRNGVKIATVSGTAATDTGLASSTTYAYTVSAYNSAGESPQSGSVQATTQASGGGSGGGGLPPGVSLRSIDGGTGYYAGISPASAWMDQHILLGGWLEEPLNATQARYDAAMGSNIYWNLAATPTDTKNCGGSPCRADYATIAASGMHASAPDTYNSSTDKMDTGTTNPRLINGPETVSRDGNDESDMNLGPVSGYTADSQFYNSVNHAYAVHQGYGKGVLFWETGTQAAKFMTVSDTESADSYWMTDSDLNLPSQGGCALLPSDPVACGNGGGSGLTTTQRALPANYAYNVTRLEHLQAMNGSSKPVVVDVETGCPGSNGACVTVPQFQAAAWHALIAGARGIVWFQHNFSGPCSDFNTFYDGSNPSSPMYNCQITPGETLRSLVQGVTAFNTEVTSLTDVLLSPFADGYVSASGDVSVMAKDSGGMFYVFAGSGQPAKPPAANQQVIFTVAGGYTGPVTVVDENRTVQATNGVFTDTLAGANAVHIYRIG